MIELGSDPRDQEFMESIQSDIEKDPEEYRASDIYNIGFLEQEGKI